MSRWPLERIGAICEFDPSKSQVRNLADGTQVSFVPMHDLGFAGEAISGRETRPISEVYKGYTYFADGDVLLAKITPCFENGKLGVAMGLQNEIGFGSSEFMVLRPGPKICARYLALYLSQKRLQELGAKAMTGAVGHKRVPKEWVQDFEIPLPPLAEQQRIVATLDEAFEGIRVTEVNAAQARRAAKEMVDSEVGAVLIEAARTYPSIELGGVVDVLDSRRRPITKSDRQAGPYPYYGATGVQDHVAGYLFDEPLVLLGEDGAKWGRGDRSAFAVSGRLWVNNHAHVLRPHRDRLADAWLIYALNAFDLAPYVTGVTVPKLNQAKMRQIVLPMPPLARQAELIDRLDSVVAKAEELVCIYDRKLALLAELKQSLLARAFSGELTREFIAA